MVQWLVFKLLTKNKKVLSHLKFKLNIKNKIKVIAMSMIKTFIGAVQTDDAQQKSNC
jgi:hypothetical protein